MRPPDWYKETVAILEQYPADKRRILALTVKLNNLLPTQTPNYSLAPGSSGTSDQTGNIGSLRAETEGAIQKLRDWTGLVEELVDRQKTLHRDILKLRFFDENATDISVAMELSLSSAAYHKHKHEAIEDLAEDLGIKKDKQTRFKRDTDNICL